MERKKEMDGWPSLGHVLTASLLPLLRTQQTLKSIQGHHCARLSSFRFSSIYIPFVSMFRGFFCFVVSFILLARANCLFLHVIYVFFAPSVWIEMNLNEVT